MADQTLEIQTGSLSVTSMRYHELALQAWLNSKFVIKSGYPVPVVFASPMDAFTRFQNLWKRDKNPFNYLFDLKDEAGKPLYEPHPAVPRYPLFSVMRKGWKYRQYQNFSIHQWRTMNWPTVSKGVKREDLGTATVSYMPMAWDYKFQIDYYSMRPDTQAFFVEKMMREFWRSGGALQTWVPINYPGVGRHLIRMTMSGDSLEWNTPDEPEPDKVMEYRTTATVTIEGYSIDVDYKFLPTLWTLVIGDATASPSELEALSPLATADLRINSRNLEMQGRTNIPATGTNAQVASTFAQTQPQFVSFGTGTQDTANPFHVVQPSVSFGIASQEAIGVPAVTIV